MKTITLLLFMFFCSMLYIVSEEDTLVPVWKKKFPVRLYINEICIRPEKDGYPNWIELWNHTEKEINLKGWSFETKEAKFKIDQDFVISPEKLGLILLYEKGEKCEEFEKKLLSECPIMRFFGMKTFPYEYISDDVMEREREQIGEVLILYDSQNAMKQLVFWGDWNEIKQYHQEIKNAQEDNVDSILADMFCKIRIYPGCSMLLTDYDRFELLTRGTSTPGRFYPQNIPVPVVEPTFGQPEYDRANFNKPEELKNEKKVQDNDLFAGTLYLHVKESGLNIWIDMNNGWDKISFELAYDEGLKKPILKNSNKEEFSFHPYLSCFRINFTFEDFLYLRGKTIYCCVTRSNKNGQIVRSEVKKITVPFIDVTYAHNMGGIALSIEDIPKSHNEINHLDDMEHLKKVNALVSKLKTVVNAIGIFDVYRFHETVDNSGKMGHLKELKISPDLSSVYIHIYLHNFECLKQNPSNNLVNCGGTTNDLYKILAHVRDFSFLKGFENLYLDLSENDIPAMGGLELVLKELNRYCKPKGLSLALTRLKDISALKGLTIEDLNISFNYDLKDISPLSGAPNLKRLKMERLALRDKIDLSPLASCPKLEVLTFTPEGCENISILKKIPTLKEINGNPAEEFFKNNGL